MKVDRIGEQLEKYAKKNETPYLNILGHHGWIFGDYGRTWAGAFANEFSRGFRQIRKNRIRGYGSLYCSLGLVHLADLYGHLSSRRLLRLIEFLDSR